MINTTTQELLKKLVQTCGLGSIVEDVETVSGGLMHRMYKVTTERGSYAVKHLNPEVMRRLDAQDNFARAERIEALLEGRGIPIIPAMVLNEKKMQTVDGHFFYVFHWQRGRLADWHHITKEECYKAGNILGQIHAIEPSNTEPQEAQPPELVPISWGRFIEKAKEQNASLASLLEEKEALLTYAEMELNRARGALPAIRCISDADMDPKNILWEDGVPWVIDLECLDYGNPVSDAIQLALQWSGIVTCEIDMNKLTAFFDGYLVAYDNGFRAYGDMVGGAYTWLEWLEYNIQRTLGDGIDEQERELGAAEVRKTIERIAYIREVEPQIRAALDCL